MIEYMVTYGGTWYYDPHASRFPERDGYVPRSRFGDLGFRVVKDPEVHVLRGGSWISGSYCYLSEKHRHWSTHDFNLNDFGFRVARDE